MVDRRTRRKLVEYDAETRHALRLLSGDSMKSLQEMAGEAFVDLLNKHGRPVTLKQAPKRARAGSRPTTRAPRCRVAQRPHCPRQPLIVTPTSATRSTRAVLHFSGCVLATALFFPFTRDMTSHNPPE